VWHAPSAKEARRLRVRGVRVARRAAGEKLAGCVWVACGQRNSRTQGVCGGRACGTSDCGREARRVRVRSMRVACG